MTTTSGNGTRILLGFAFALIIGALVCAAIVSADPANPTTLGQLSSGRGSVTSSIKTDPAEAGNVSELALTANAITKAWQGYFGNISGQILLADALGNNFYTWNNTNVKGEIYASRNDTVQWATINCSNSTVVTAENAYLAKQATDPDAVNQTFRLTTHPAFSTGSANLTGCPSVQMYGPSSQTSASNFWNVLLQDSLMNAVYTTVINRTTVGFRNSATDFELLVAENGNATNLAPTTYYFYVELD